MRLLRQTWAICILAVVLAVLAIIYDRPALLAASCLIGVWVLTRQYVFIRELSRVTESLSVTQTPSKTSLHTGNSTTVTLAATIEDASQLQLELTAGVPPAATIPESLEFTMRQGTTEQTQTKTIDWPVAGNHQFQQTRVTASDGLFRETVPVGSTPAVTVEPPNPRNMHIGIGGTRVPMARGEHKTGHTGSGLQPAELREYVPGDTAEKIDWKATARLATPYVRTYETETDRPTLIVLDHRSHLSTGQLGQTKLDYLREVALSIAASASSLSDPLGHLAIGDEGITRQIHPTTGRGTYTTIRRELLEIEPTEAASQNQTNETKNTAPEYMPTQLNYLSEHSSEQYNQSITGSTTTRRTLANGDSEFVRKLKLFYEKQPVYSTRIQTDPLTSAVESMLANENGSAFVVLCTDDSNPTELKHTVQLARAKENTVMVLLAPSVLFESGGLLDAERAYNSYLTFERLRQDIDQLEGVSALEIGPEDRLGAVLAAGGSDR